MHRIRSILLPVLLVTLIGVPMSAAVAADEPLTNEIIGTHLIAKGVVVDVEVEYSCTPLQNPEPPNEALYEETFVDVTIMQRVAKGQAYGNSATWFEGDSDCDGKLHRLIVTVPADPGGSAFKPGSAAILVTTKASYGWYNTDDPDNWYQYEFFDREVGIDWTQVKLQK